MDNELGDLVQKLRLIDSIVDFARGYIQLSVMLTAINGEKIFPDYTAERLKIPRKSVIDAIQKLKRKGLLYRSKGNIYVLTEKGHRFYTLLCEVISALSPSVTVENIIESYRVSEAILIIGTSMKDWVRIEKVSKYIGLPPDDLEKLLRIRASSLVAIKRDKDKTLISLTREGRKLYELLLESIGLGSLTAKTLALLTGTLDPRNALRRFMAVYLFISMLVFLELTQPLYGVISASVWAVTSLYIAFLIYSKK